jgi:predicted nucleic acid-binding protein
MLWQTESWFKYKVIQIAWKLARRIVPMVKSWDKLKQWDTIGLIKFWSQVTIILPKNNIEILTKIWDIVIDWETALASIK